MNPKVEARFQHIELFMADLEKVAAFCTPKPDCEPGAAK